MKPPELIPPFSRHFCLTYVFSIHFINVFNVLDVPNNSKLFSFPYNGQILQSPKLRNSMVLTHFLL